MTGVTNYSDNGCISFRCASLTDLTLWLTSTSEWIRAIIHFPTYASSFLVKTIKKCYKGLAGYLKLVRDFAVVTMLESLV